MTVSNKYSFLMTMLWASPSRMSFFLTGLPIQGKPVIFSKSFDDDTFFRVFGRFEKMTKLPFKDIMAIALNVNEEYRPPPPPPRKIAVLLIICCAFIAPNNDKHEIPSAYVQFVENLDEVDSYAWGAALLACIYHGINMYKKEKKKCINGNLWILLVQLGINLKEYPQSVRDGDSWLSWIVRKIKKKTHNHYAKYDIGSILPLSDEDINWTPYAGMVCPLPRDLDSVRDPVPIFCYIVVVHHKPHHCSKQFPIFKSYHLESITWEDYEIKFKQRKGGHRQDYLALHKKEIDAWNARKPAEAYMTAIKNEHSSRSNDDSYDCKVYNNDSERGQNSKPDMKW